MTPPPQYGAPPPAPSNDKVTLWGVLGIIILAATGTLSNMVSRN